MIILILGTMIALVIITAITIVGDSGLLTGEPQANRPDVPSQHLERIATPEAQEAAREAQNIIYRKIEQSKEGSGEVFEQRKPPSPDQIKENTEFSLNEKQIRSVARDLRDKGYEVARSDEFEAFLKARWLTGESSDR